MIKFAKLTPEAIYPKKATEGSAGFDLYLYKDMYINPKDRAFIPTGLAHECPSNLFATFAPRSGLALKQGLRLFFSPCIIDSDYRGEIKVLVENRGNKVIYLKKGDRFAQILYLNIPSVPAENVEFEHLSKTNRGGGGFGSTGS